jgi:hypothetical protein
MKLLWVKSCGLYYKHITIINDDCSIINKWRVSRSDDTRVVIYDCNMFMIQATGHFLSVLEERKPKDRLFWFREKKKEKYDKLSLAWLDVEINEAEKKEWLTKNCSFY